MWKVFSACSQSSQFDMQWHPLHKWPSLSVQTSMLKQCQLIVYLYANFFWAAQSLGVSRGCRIFIQEFKVNKSHPCKFNLTATGFAVQLEIQLFLGCSQHHRVSISFFMFSATLSSSSVIILSSAFLFFTHCCTRDWQHSANLRKQNLAIHCSWLNNSYFGCCCLEPYARMFAAILLFFFPDKKGSRLSILDKAWIYDTSHRGNIKLISGL